VINCDLARARGRPSARCRGSWRAPDPGTGWRSGPARRGRRPGPAAEV